VSDLTPEQEAWYALGWNLPRSELSAAAQLEYDRFKPDWEHDAKLRQEAIWAKVHKVDQTGTIHKFCFHPHRQVIIGVMIAAFGAAILAAAVALGLFDFSQTGLWWEICFVAMGLFCVWAAICRFRMGVHLRTQRGMLGPRTTRVFPCVAGAASSTGSWPRPDSTSILSAAEDRLGCSAGTGPFR